MGSMLKCVNQTLVHIAPQLPQLFQAVSRLGSRDKPYYYRKYCRFEVQVRTYDVKEAKSSRPVTIAPGAHGPNEVSRSI